jgi:hypothetical protein
MSKRKAGSAAPADEISYAFDEAVYAHGMEHRTRFFDLEVTSGGDGQLLRVRSHTPDPVEGFCRAGCFIQKFDPCFWDASSRRESSEPVISCIILLTFNCYFVRHFLIPSIVACTTVPYEIIVVYNGVATDLSPFDPYTVIQSETGCVSKGYNKGVAAARGRFVAIFHDDCLVMSPGWHQPMTEALEKGAFATSTESVYHPPLDLTYLKGTPLVMTKAGYALIGGHDEFFFGGIEDLEFSFRIQSKGYTIKRINTAYRHFRGMSTVILLSGRAGEMRTLFGYCLIPEDTIERWKTRYAGAPEIRGMMQDVNRENLLYFQQKCMGQAPPAGTPAARSPDPARYPALSHIRTRYRQWLLEKF